MEETNLKTIPEFLDFHQRKHPDREAVVFAHSDGKRTAVTFGQLYEQANIMAKSFVILGVKKSEFIAINLNSCPEWLYATCGAILAGACPISFSFTYTDGSDVVAMMKKLKTCSTIILDTVGDVATWNIFQNLIRGFDKEGHVRSDLMPYLKYMICRQKLPDMALTLEDMTSWNLHVKLPSVSPDDLVTLFQTSGSTGFPKACVHTNRSLIALSLGIANTLSSSKGTRMFNDRPFTYSGGFPWNIITGETRITRYGYCDPPEDMIEFLVNVINSEKCSCIFVLPPLLKQFINRQVIEVNVHFDNV